MEFIVKCPHCKGKQKIDINLEKYEQGYKYYDCQLCLDVFEFVINIQTKELFKKKI